MEKESPVPVNGPSQSSVKFKENIVDFISPTPEPEFDSEEDPGTSQNTPRSDMAEESPRQLDSSDPASTLSEGSSSTSMKNETSAESEPEEKSLPVADGSRDPVTSPSEVELTKSDQKIDSTADENSSESKKSEKTGTQSDAEPNQANTGNYSEASVRTESAKTDVERTHKSRSSPSSKATGKQLSNRNKATNNAKLAAKVVGMFEKPAENARPKSAEVKPAGRPRSSKIRTEPTGMAADPESNDMAEKNSSESKKLEKTGTPSDAEPNQAITGTISEASGMETVKNDAEGSDKTCSSPASKPAEEQLSDRNQAVYNAKLAAQVVGSLRPKSAEIKPTATTAAAAAAATTTTTTVTTGTPRSSQIRTESNRMAGDSECDDMALVECSGRFRMMSVAELTALQRRTAAGRSPDAVGQTPRLPPSPSMHTPRLPELFCLNDINSSE